MNESRFYYTYKQRLNGFTCHTVEQRIFPLKMSWKNKTVREGKGGKEGLIKETMYPS